MSRDDIDARLTCKVCNRMSQISEEFLTNIIVFHYKMSYLGLHRKLVTVNEKYATSKVLEATIETDHIALSSLPTQKTSQVYLFSGKRTRFKKEEVPVLEKLFHIVSFELFGAATKTTLFCMVSPCL